MDESEAVEKALAGDGEAFGMLVSRYQMPAYAATLARVYDAQDAQDLVQEAFLRAYTRLPMLRNRQRFGPWFFTILRRLSVDFSRGKWRTEQGAHRMESSDGLLAPSADPRPEIAAKDIAKTLWTLVSRLDENSREVLSLYYGQQMKVTEIAELTGMRESAVKMRLQKARTVLGGQAADLQGVWGAASLPPLSLDLMAAIKAAGPVGTGTSAALSSLLGWFSFLALPGWFLGKDLERWRGHAPAGMEKQAKRNIAAAIVIGVLAFQAGRYLTQFMGQDARIMVPYFVIMAVLMGAIFWREIALIPAREKIKQSINTCYLSRESC